MISRPCLWLLLCWMVDRTHNLSGSSPSDAFHSPPHLQHIDKTTQKTSFHAFSNQSHCGYIYKRHQAWLYIIYRSQPFSKTLSPYIQYLQEKWKKMNAKCSSQHRAGDCRCEWLTFAIWWWWPCLPSGHWCTPPHTWDCTVMSLAQTTRGRRSRSTNASWCRSLPNFSLFSSAPVAQATERRQKEVCVIMVPVIKDLTLDSLWMSIYCSLLLVAILFHLPSVFPTSLSPATLGELQPYLCLLNRHSLW